MRPDRFAWNYLKFVVAAVAMPRVAKRSNVIRRIEFLLLLVDMIER